MKNSIKFFLPTLLLGLVFNACIKEDFDQPPTEGSDPGLTANATIAQLKALHNFGELETIAEDWIIKATVVADDASGNLYQSFVVQDETGGIMVKIETADSYTLYPVGRELYIKCKGLVLGDYNNLIQLGGFKTDDQQLGNIIKISDHLIRGKKVTPPAPKVRKLSELTFDDVNTLVTLTDVQFVDTAFNFADPITQTTYNRDLVDCDGVTMIVRTSGFANFAGASLPNGGGSLTGILGIFRDDLQFLVRDLHDVDMNGNRCAGGGGGGDPCAGGPTPIVAGVDEDFESLVDYDPVTLNGWTNIALKGSRNWQAREFGGDVYAQATAYNDNSAEMDTWLVTPRIDLTEPLVLTFETAQDHYTHDGFSVLVSTDFECDPITATWVAIPATIAGQNDANYAWVPSGNVDLSALVGQKIAIGFHYVGSGTSGQTGTFRVNNVKLGMGGGSTDPCSGVTPTVVSFLNEDFSAGTNNASIALAGWTNAVVTGARTWIYKFFATDGNTYAQATAFNDTSPNMETWLVTPLVDIVGPMTLSFETAKAFYTHDGFSVLVSTDFTCDPTAATWAPLVGAAIAGQANVDNEWVFSGDVDLSSYIGKEIAIAFKYVGSGPGGQTGTFRVDNVVVQ